MVSTDDSWSAPRIDGRPLRVLHIGNIANNAYINARMMNAAGVDCDVLVPEYYHIMGCPEWEDADFAGELGDHFKPRWHAVDLGGFERPRWFASGPTEWCLRYLLARREGREREANLLWRYLDLVRRMESTVGSPAALQAATRLAEHARSLAIHALGRLKRPLDPYSDEAQTRYQQLAARWRELHPDRDDALTHDDLCYCLRHFDLWQRLMQHYDVVQGYADMAIYPLLYHEGPYTAFEHGTLRDLPFEPSAIGRKVALSFAEAGHVFVTNADCVDNAAQISGGRHTFINHPYDDRQSGRVSGWQDLRAELLAGGAEALLYFPTRHDWIAGKGFNDKGNDVFLRAFARLVKEGRKLKLVCTAWGNNVDDSKQLLRELGVDHAVTWSEPVGNYQFERLILASDMVVDQFVLGAFGGVTYKSLAAGRPVVVYLDEAQMTKLYGEAPPVTNCRTEDEVYAEVAELLDDPQHREGIGRLARNWVRKFHSGQQTLRTQVDIYTRLLRGESTASEAPPAEPKRRQLPIASGGGGQA